MENTNSLLTVIIPIYNAEKTIKRCLDSVLSQTYKNLQIILIDDGSKDQSLSICSKYEKEDKRVKCYKQNHNGVSRARNLGIEKAEGKYITFVDSDDYIKKDTYEKALKKIGDTDIIMFGFYERYEEADHSKTISPKVEGILNAKDAIYECMIPLGYEVTVWNKIYKTELIKRIKFDVSLKISEDELWLIKILKTAKKVCLYNEPFYYYVQNKGSTMRSDSVVDEKWLTAIKAKKAVVDELANIRRCNELSKAKIYHNLFKLLINSYCSNDCKSFDMIKKEIDPYKKCFYKAKEYSANIKIKYSIIMILFYIKAPIKMVRTLEKITTYKIKLYFKNVKLDI